MIMLSCPKCNKPVNTFTTICSYCKHKITEYDDIRKIDYSLEEMIQMYTKNINGYEINMMDLYIKNNQNLKKSIKELSEITNIDKYHAKKFINSFEREYIRGTEMVEKYKSKLQ